MLTVGGRQIWYLSAVRTFFRVLPFVALAATSPAATIGASALTTGQNGNAISQPGTVTSSMTATIGGAQAEATVDFGSASVNTYSNCGNAPACSAEAFASFSDGITILDAWGFLQASPWLGAVQAYGDGDASSSFTFGSASGVFLTGYFGTPCLFGIPACTFQQAFYPGVKIGFSGSAYALASDYSPRDPFDGSESDWAQMRFTFAVLDSNGQPLSAFHYTSDSGHDYGLMGGAFVATPEPSTAILIAGSLWVLLSIGRVRRGAASRLPGRTLWR